MVVSTFEHKGKTWTRVPARPLDRFIVGVDLGQSIDSTAICVIQHSVTPLVDSDWEVDEMRCVTKQRSEERFDVRHLERLPLGMSYPEQAQAVANILSRPPLRKGCDLLVDETGVGRAVSDIFDHAGLRPIRVCIVAGFDAENKGGDRWTVPKTQIVSALDARLHTGELRFAAALREAGTMADELKDFRRHVGAAGRATYNARAGAHDDLVLSVGIALWWATKPARGEFSVGTVAGCW